jgi:hypothetical protein
MFKNGEVRYTNQFIPSPRFSIERELGEEYFPTIGEYKGMLGLLKLSFHAQLVKEKIKDLKTVRAKSIIYLPIINHYYSSESNNTGRTTKHKYHYVQQEALLSARGQLTYGMQDASRRAIGVCRI